MVNWWFGFLVWIPGIPLCKGLLLGCIPIESQSTNLGASSPSDPSGTGNKVFLNENWVEQGSLNYLFGGHQTMQIYGRFEGFPINNALFGLVI